MNFYIKRILLVLSIFLFINIVAFCQDIQFSEPYSAKLYLNPSYAGTSKCPQITSNFKTQNNINKKELENLARKYTINTSEMYKITTYQTVSTTIIDNDTAITLKKLEGDMANTIRDMLDITILKGWDLTSLIIKGTPDFVYETKNQIKRRLEPNRIEQKTLQRNNSTHLKI